MAFKDKDMKKTWYEIVNKCMKFRIPLPSKIYGDFSLKTHEVNNNDDPELVANEHFLRRTIKENFGSFHLSTESLIKYIFRGETEWYKSDLNRNLVLRLFLFNMKITVVLPESFFPLDHRCSELTCPVEGCCSKLKFSEVKWDTPRLLMRLNGENEVLIPAVYTCTKGHKITSIEAEFLELLPSYVQTRYSYSTNKSICLDTNDG